MKKLRSGVILLLLLNVHVMVVVGAFDYGEALSKCILFFEGQRSGKLPSSQRMTWRKDSGLKDGSDVGVDLVGGYYDAGDNMKFNFPMAFTSTMLAWSVLEYGKFMGNDTKHALDAVKWGTDYFLKSTEKPDIVYAQVGEVKKDHDCWERPEDMDTGRNTYFVSKDKPGSEVAAEMSAALSSASMVFKDSDPKYSKLLLERAITVFEFADKYRGTYNESLGDEVCPYYCDFNGYQDELLWSAAWLYKATKQDKYWNYVKSNATSCGYNFAEFGWDGKYGGINVLASQLANTSSDAGLFVPHANKLVCALLPESPTKAVNYTAGGLLYAGQGSNLQAATSKSFLMLIYADYLQQSKTNVSCGNVNFNSTALVRFANNQVDYILGNNPMNMSYMVGFGKKYPLRLHHRASSLPSVDAHPKPFDCHTGAVEYAESKKPNPNELTGAVTGGPAMNDTYADAREVFTQSEPTTYINAPLVGVLAFLKSIHK